MTERSPLITAMLRTVTIDDKAVTGQRDGPAHVPSSSNLQLCRTRVHQDQLVDVLLERCLAQR